MAKEKFLGDETMERGTGVQVGATVKALIDEWKLASRIVAINYDTCSVNTGRDLGKERNGALSRKPSVLFSIQHIFLTGFLLLVYRSL